MSGGNIDAAKTEYHVCARDDMQTMTISDQFELTIDPDILRRAGFQPGDTVRVDDSGESVVIRRSDGTAESTTTDARIEEIVNYVRELRGHDEFD